MAESDVNPYWRYIQACTNTSGWSRVTLRLLYAAFPRRGRAGPTVAPVATAAAQAAVEAALVEFRVLGPVEAIVEGDDRQITGGPLPRAILALLLISSDPISRDRLVDELWGIEPPKTAVNALHVHLSSLRRLLGDRLQTTPAGYVLTAEPGDRIDLAEFDQDLRAATLHGCARRWRCGGAPRSAGPGRRRAWRRRPFGSPIGTRTRCTASGSRLSRPATRPARRTSWDRRWRRTRPTSGWSPP